MHGTSAEPLLVACPDPGHYRAVLAAAGDLKRAVPILGSIDVPLRGFPPGTRVIPVSAFSTSGTAEASAPTSGQVCIAADDPACRAVAGLVERQGKRLSAVVGLAELPDAVSDAQTAAPRSLTFVIPGWGPTGAADSGWVAAVVRTMRRHFAAGRHVSWGMICGPDATSLSLLAAKAALSDRIVSAYRGTPSAFFSTFHDATLASTPLGRFDPATAGPALQLIDESHVRDGSAREAVRRRWNVLVFKSHGRPYCASHGYLCGARPTEVAPDAPLTGCLHGMSCVSADYPQLDPRLLDAPVMVLDACGTGSWSAASWADGIPSLAFHAAAGYPSAVISSDAVTMNRAGDFLDVFWALRTCDTLGAAVTALNRHRHDRGASARLTYYLIGDPDQPAGVTRWPDWVTPAPTVSQDDPHRVTVAPAPAPYHSVVTTTDVAADEVVAHVWPSNGGSLRGVRMFPTGSSLEVWFGLAADTAEPTEIQLSVRRPPAMPAALVRGALEFGATARSWSPLLDTTAARIASAADQVLRVQRLLDGLAGTARLGHPRGLITAAAVAHDAWLAAHNAAVTDILAHTSGGLWPFRFWSVSGVFTSERDDPCPTCGTAPTLRRRYRSLPFGEREQWECLRCDLIHDVPARTDFPAPTLIAPERLEVGDEVALQVTVDGTRCAQPSFGAAAAVVDGTGHGVVCDQEVTEITVQAGACVTVSSTVRLPSAPERPHLWRSRGTGLLDGHWFLLSKPILVGPRH